jgi:hypothetical protein
MGSSKRLHLYQHRKARSLGTTLSSKTIPALHLSILLEGQFLGLYCVLQRTRRRCLKEVNESIFVSSEMIQNRNSIGRSDTSRTSSHSSLRGFGKWERKKLVLQVLTAGSPPHQRILNNFSHCDPTHKCLLGPPYVAPKPPYTLSHL